MKAMMFTDEIVFSFTEIDGKPWFAGRDVLQILNIRPTRAAAAYAELSDQDVQFLPNTKGTGNAFKVVSLNGLRSMIRNSDCAFRDDFLKRIDETFDHDSFKS